MNVSKEACMHVQNVIIRMQDRPLDRVFEWVPKQVRDRAWQVVYVDFVTTEVQEQLKEQGLR